MKILKVLPLLMLLIVSTLLGQQGFPPPPREGDRVKELKEKLKLTDEQTKKIETIFNNNKKKMDASFEKKEQRKSDPRAMMDSIMKATDKEIEKILTKEQKEKYSKMMEERKKEKRDMPPPPPPQGRMEKRRGMCMPEEQYGFQDRMERPEEISGQDIQTPEQFDGPEMQRPFSPRMERFDLGKNSGHGCCCMQGGRMMPPPPPPPADDEDFLAPDDEMFEL